jgi:MoxR-like ATPase
MADNTEERIVSGKPKEGDKALDKSLRPKRLSEYIGQDKVKENVKIAIDAAKARKEALDHVLIYGPPGLGKTSLAYLIAKELGVGIKPTSGPVIERAGDLAAILTNLRRRDLPGKNHWAVEQGTGLAARVEQAKAVFRSPAFYDGDASLEAFGVIVQALELASLPFAPAQLSCQILAFLAA